MRTFIQTTAGGTFFGDSSLTTVIRKDHAEYIFKLGDGYYAVVNLYVVSPTDIMLIANWGTFFNRIINNTDKDALFNKLRDTCPTLYEMFSDKKAPFSVISLKGVEGKGIGGTFPCKINRYIPEILGDSATIEKAGELVDYSAKVYNEIVRNSPFPGWKKGLVEDM